MDMINNSKAYPKCDSVLWREHLQDCLNIPEVISVCSKLKILINEKGM